MSRTIGSEQALTQDRLRQLIHYDPLTGLFTWPVTGRRPGLSAGSINSHGYMVIGIEGRVYRAHRLAWLYVTGEWPKDQIDHKDRDRANNRWVNLRHATNAENSRNRSVALTSSSGVTGVCWDKAVCKWFSRIEVNGRRTNLGRFEDFDAAVAARTAAEVALGFHPNHGSTAVGDAP